MPENKEATPAAEAHQDLPKAGIAKTEAAATALASDELSDDELEAVAGGLAAKRISSL